MAVGVADPQLVRKLTAHRVEAGLAVQKTWRWRKRMGPVVGAGFFVGVVASAGHSAGSVLFLLAFALVVGMGLRPCWQHARDALPPHFRPPQGR